LIQIEAGNLSRPADAPPLNPWGLPSPLIISSDWRICEFGTDTAVEAL
jgi:hypothetical protein